MKTIIQKINENNESCNNTEKMNKNFAVVTWETSPYDSFVKIVPKKDWDKFNKRCKYKRTIRFESDDIQECHDYISKHDDVFFRTRVYNGKI